MANCTHIAYDNLVDQGTLVINDAQPSGDPTENSRFPLANIQKREPHKRMKPFTSTDTSLTLRLTLSSALAADLFFIIGHPIDGLDPTTVTINAYSDAGFTSLIQSEVITGFNFNEKVGFGEFSSEITAQYWEFIFVKAGGGLSVSNIFLGKDLGVNRNIPAGSNSGKNDLSKITIGRFGHKFQDKIGVKPKFISMTFEALLRTERVIFDAMFDAIGTTQNVYVMADTADTNKEIRAGVYSITAYPRTTLPTFGLYNQSAINFQEVI